MNYARALGLYMRDTHVRILLNLCLEDRAFPIVKTVLDEAPSFGDFQDFYNNREYKQWMAG